MEQLQSIPPKKKKRIKALNQILTHIQEKRTFPLIGNRERKIGCVRVTVCVGLGFFGSKALQGFYFMLKLKRRRKT